MNTNFEKSVRRPSLGVNKNRIALGGQVQKKNKISIDLFSSTIQNKFVRQNSQIQVLPERDSNRPYGYSTISYSEQSMASSTDHSKQFQTIASKNRAGFSVNSIYENIES